MKYEEYKMLAIYLNTRYVFRGDTEKNWVINASYFQNKLEREHVLQSCF